MIPIYVAGCFGMFHPAATPHGLPHPPASRHGTPHPAAGRHGVLICSTLGDEALNVYRPLVHLAEHFAAAGTPALRLEYYGAGDSGGEDGEPGRFQAWLDGIAAGVTWLREHCGVGPVTLVGVRVGAVLAARAACDIDDVAALVLLVPLAGGRRFVREQVLRANANAEIWQVPSRIEDGGWFEAYGIRLDRPTRDALEQLDVARLPHRPAPRALVLEQTEATGAVAQRLSRLGTDVDSESFAELGDMLRDPYENTVPHAAFARAVAWHRQLAQAEDAEPATPAVRSAATPATHNAATTATNDAATTATHYAATTATHSAATIAMPAPAPAVLHTDAGRESPIRFGPDGALFGILSTPAHPRDHAPPVLIANTGANPRSGNSRSAVIIARWLAAHGIASLRMDSAGAGDAALSTGAHGQPYSAQEDRDIAAGITELAQRSDGKVLLLGMCSGAFHALRAAYDNPRVAGLMLVNLQKFAWQDGESLSVVQRSTLRTTRFYLQHAGSKAVWQRLLRGDVNVSGIGRALLGRALRRGMACMGPVLVPLLRHETRASLVRRNMRRLQQRGVPVLFVLSGNDPGLDEISEYFGANGRQLRRQPNIMFHLLEGADHTISMHWAREALLGLIATFLRQRCHLAIEAGEPAAAPQRLAPARCDATFAAPVAIDSTGSAA